MPQDGSAEPARRDGLDDLLEAVQDRLWELEKVELGSHVRTAGSGEARG